MNSECMGRMTPKELEAYAKAMGFTTKAAAGAEAKADLIAKRRNRVVEMRVIGVDLSVPIKRAHDKRVSDLLGKRGRTDADVTEAFRLLLGDDQLKAVHDAATDEDGTVDEAAITYAFNAVLENPELKNF